jgi:hypothetical protein
MGSEERERADRPAQPGVIPDPVILELRYRPPEGGSDRGVEAADSGDLTRADLARQLNTEIYNAGRFSCRPEDEELELTFFCACGCMAEVKRSLRDYVTLGAIVAGHSRPADHR